MVILDNVSFHYKKGRQILKCIGTTLAPGHIYGLLGLNGVGKTTLLKLIGGLSFPKSGTIAVNGRRPEDREIDFLADIYFFTDEVDLPNWSIKRFVETYAPLYPRFDRTYFEQLLHEFQTNKEEHLANLSYGQRKKVNIAFGLATHAKVLLMDEPTNGLDIPSKGQFRKALSQYVSDDKIIVISTHHIQDIHHLVDHLLVLQQQQLTVDASVLQLSRHFRFTTALPAGEQSLYSENSLQGFRHMIRQANEDYDGLFDIEMFFNAISSHPELTNTLFIHATSTLS